MRTTPRRAWPGLLIVLAVLLSSMPAHTASSSLATGKRVKARKPPADKGPAETRSERDLRLQRECRGKPNAGACEGYAS